MRRDPREPEFLRPADAAALAGLSTRAIYRAIERGELPACRLCSRLRISAVAFDEWVARCEVPPALPAAPTIAPLCRPVERGSFRHLLARRQDPTS